MSDFEVVGLVAVFFLLRIGIPVIALITLGTIIERWQVRREQEQTRSWDSRIKPS